MGAQLKWHIYIVQLNNFFRVNSTKTTCSFSVLNMISCRNRTNKKFFFPTELKYKQALHFLIRSSYGILHFGVITTENQEEKVFRWKDFLRMFSLLIIASATCLTNGMVKSFYTLANYHHATLHLKNTGAGIPRCLFSKLKICPPPKIHDGIAVRTHSKVTRNTEAKVCVYYSKKIKTTFPRLFASIGKGFILILFFTN